MGLPDHLSFPEFGIAITRRPDLGDLYWPDYDANPVGCYAKVLRGINDMDFAINCCEKKGCVIQAGGHLGMWAKKLSDIFDVVLCLEPDPNLFACMKMNLRDTKNVIIWEAALGDSNANVNYHQHPSAGSGHIGAPHPKAKKVLQGRIDDLPLEKFGCDLILLDVEDYEINVLKGATATIEAYHPVIQVEIGLLTPTVADYLKTFDYMEGVRAGRDMVYEWRGR